MVYESGFTTRRTYSSRPVTTSYAVTTPRLDLCTDRPGSHRSRASSDYSYTSKSTVEKSSYDSSNPYARPERSTYTSSVEKSSRSGPGGSYNYSTERTSTTGAGPGGYSYSSTTSGNLPGGTKYRHFSYHVYKTSYPIYSSYSIPRRIFSGTRVISSPVRVVTSPTRIVSRIVHSPSPVRVVRTTTRVVTSPERTTSYSYTSPTLYHSPSYVPLSYYSSSYIPTSYTTYTPSYHYKPTTITRVYTRSASPMRITTSPVRVTPSYLRRLPPGYGARALTNYLNTEPFSTFSEETGRIRNRAQSLMRDLHTPVVRRARSCTPFPVTGYSYGPTSQLALDAYVARVTNPVRHIAKEVHNISHYPKPAVKYVGKSHLASVRICGDKAYNVRSPMYDSDKVRTDINLLSWYLRHPTWKNEKQNSVPHQQDPELDPNRPSRKFSAPRPLEDAIELESKEKQRQRKERLLTVNEESLHDTKSSIKKENEEASKREAEKLRAAEKLAEEQRLAKEAAKIIADKEAAHKAEEEARIAKEKRFEEEAAQRAAAAKEAARKLEEETRLAEQAAQKAAVEAARKAEEEAARLAEEEAARKAEEEAARKAEEEAARKAEEEAARIAEEEAARVAEEEAARRAEEEAARVAEEEAARVAEEAARKNEEEVARKAEEDQLAAEVRLEEEKRLREEELCRLAEIEKQAEEEREGELARQAAELAEIARQEAEIVTQELQSIRKEGRDDEPVINEPETPVEDIQEEPIIDLNSKLGGNSFELENAGSDYLVEGGETEEEE